jgi:hypothetical protein
MIVQIFKPVLGQAQDDTKICKGEFNKTIYKMDNFPFSIIHYQFIWNSTITF